MKLKGKQGEAHGGIVAGREDERKRLNAPTEQQTGKRLCEDLAGNIVAGCSSGSQVKRCRRLTAAGGKHTGAKTRRGDEYKH